jgi:hypothetical protein
MKLKCQCCGFAAKFKDGDEAFDAGWYAPPNFSHHVSCPLCPAVCALGVESHSLAHAHWNKYGRPREFNAFCAGDSLFGDKAAFDEVLSKGREIASAVLNRIVKGNKNHR